VLLAEMLLWPPALLPITPSSSSPRVEVLISRGAQFIDVFFFLVQSDVHVGCGAEIAVLLASSASAWSVVQE
jgi:hypothetical protein